MKRFLAILLALLIALVPLSCRSSAAQSFVNRPTEITCEYVYYDDSWWALMDDYGFNLSALKSVLEEHYLIGDCSFDLALWIDTAPINGTVEWRFLREYYSCEIVCCILLSNSNQYVLWNKPNSDGSVSFYWGDIKSDNYCMFIFSGTCFDI